jgi:SAM-dependent MidA family methyltransferase
MLMFEIQKELTLVGTVLLMVRSRCNLPGPAAPHTNFCPDVPDAPMAVIAQEFFDALPVYQFEWGGSGWRERMVDLDTTSENPSWFRFVTSPKASLASSTLIRCTFIFV